MVVEHTQRTVYELYVVKLGSLRSNKREERKSKRNGYEMTAVVAHVIAHVHSIGVGICTLKSDKMSLFLNGYAKNNLYGLALSYPGMYHLKAWPSGNSSPKVCNIKILEEQRL